MSDTENDEAVEDQIAAEMGDDEPTDPPEPDPEPDDEPEPEPELEPVAPEPASDTEQIAAQDAYAKLARNYLAKNMGDVFGDDATSYVECPFCNFTGTPGFLHASPCPPELLGTVYEWTNTTAPDEYQKDSYSRVCQWCNGLGEVATGSKVRGQEALTCIECSGKGWIAVGDERGGGGMFTPNGPQAAYVPPDPDAAPTFTASTDKPPEMATLEARGYVVIPPMVAG